MTVIDSELDRVFDHIEALDPMSIRFDRVIRSTYDQLYDGQHTGRFTWDSLYKTEKTHFGTLVEINVQREFDFANGSVLDFSIEDVEVDCKFSQTPGGWMLPPEVVGKLCLLVTSSDLLSTFSVGLVRADDALLNEGRNRDGKRTLNTIGRESVRWLHFQRPLTENLLLHLTDEERYEIVTPASGQQRIYALFRLVQQRVVTRTVVATVARQSDYMKRVRDNGGARARLQPEGIVILGGYGKHAAVARALDLPVPPNGGFVSVRLAPAEVPGPGQVELDGRFWRVARPEDPVVEAPKLPTTRREAS